MTAILHFIRVTVPDGMELKFPRNFLDTNPEEKGYFLQTLLQYLGKTISKSTIVYQTKSGCN